MLKQGYFGILIFIIFCVFSMYYYPGGTIIDPSTVGYLFYYNFLSNLGEWTAQNGEQNFISAYLFNFSLITLSFSYIIFYYNFLRIIINETTKKVFKLILISSIILSLLGFVCVAIYSADQSTFDLHLLFVKIAFYSLLFHSFFQTVVIKSIKKFRRILFSITFSFTIILFLFILIMEFGPSPFEGEQSLFIQVTSQKIIVISILIYYYFQVKEALKFLN